MTVRRIDSLERLHNSVNGNPRFRVYFTDGSVAQTQSDASFNYGLTDGENFNVDVEVTFAKSGRITNLVPVARVTHGRVPWASTSASR